MSGPVLAAQHWPTNGHLIADVARLWIKPTDVVLDVTYGRGRWWTRYKPEHFIAHDLRLDGVDFRQLPEDDASVDVVAFDPPYVSPGGRATTTLPDFHDRYGMSDTPRTPSALQEMNDAGLKETARVLAPRGIVLAKTQPYVSSGRLQPGPFHTVSAAEALGLEVIDCFVMVGRRRPQPARARQLHARQNCSTLLVLGKPDAHRRTSTPPPHRRPAPATSSQPAR